MTTRSDPEYVFPTKPLPGIGGSFGLTKRELFAAMALQGLLANQRTRHADDPGDAVVYADALIAALKESP